MLCTPDPREPNKIKLHDNVVKVSFIAATQVMLHDG